MEIGDNLASLIFGVSVLAALCFMLWIGTRRTDNSCGELHCDDSCFEDEEEESDEPNVIS